MNCMGYKLLHLVIGVLFQFLTMFNTIIGAGAALRYGSGSDSHQIMRLIAAPAPQHTFAVVPAILQLKIRYVLLKKSFGNYAIRRQ
jgi:hypothetical protein